MKNSRLGYVTLVILGMLVMAVFVTGCTNAAGGSGSVSLNDMIEELCKDADVPAYETITLTKENFESYAFTSYDESLSAAAADALVNITPHSLVVIHAGGGNGKDLAEDIILNADPNKWLCVGSEIAEVAYTEHYVVLVMSYKDTADAIVSKFKDMAKDLDGTEANVLTVGNTRYE